jgi:uncharacterized protein DUF2510
MNQTPAGWYPDTQNPQFQRYWDGSRWTEHTAPAAGYAQAGAVAQPGPAALQVLNPYDKRFDLNQLSPEQREEYKQHTLTEFPTWAVVVLSILTLGIFGTIYHGLKHSRLPLVKSDDFTAGKGIGFLFIPFFNLYWVFVFWLRLVDRINFQYRLRGASDPISRDLTLWTIILSFFTWLIPVSPILALIVAGQIQSATNGLVKGEVEPAVLGAGAGAPAGVYQAPQPAQPQPAPAQPQEGQEPPPPGPPPPS